MMLKSPITNLVISIVLFFVTGLVKNFYVFLFLLSISTLSAIIAVIKSSKRIKQKEKVTQNIVILILSALFVGLLFYT
jgi:hypothetical protein